MEKLMLFKVTDNTKVSIYVSDITGLTTSGLNSGCKLHHWAGQNIVDTIVDESIEDVTERINQYYINERLS